MSTLRFTLPATLLALSTAACSFSMQAGGRSNNTQPKSNTPATTTPAANNGNATTPSRTVGVSRVPRPSGKGTALAQLLARRKGTKPPATDGGSTTVTDPSFVSSTTVFGGPDGSENSFVGLIYFLDANTTKLPTNLDTMAPRGAMFVDHLNVAPNTNFAGFPGVENRANNFAIRYEAPFPVETEADYELRLVSDDGAKLYIDDMLILDNDGVKSSATEVKGPVHLIKAAHTLRIDYFHTTGPVGLQVYVTAPGKAEALLGTSL